MILTEEKKISLEAGELIHFFANHLEKKTIQIEAVSPLRIELIIEISESLRRPTSDSRTAPLLLSEGFSIADYPRSSWIELASRLLDADKKTSVSDIIKLVSK